MQCVTEAFSEGSGPPLGLPQGYDPYANDIYANSHDIMMFEHPRVGIPDVLLFPMLLVRNNKTHFAPAGAGRACLLLAIAIVWSADHDS